MPLIATAFRHPLGSGYTRSQKHNESSTYLYDDDPGYEYHIGEDWSNKASGGAVYAAANGEIAYAGLKGSFGYLVVVHHTLADGSIVSTTYGHLKSILVFSGEVKVGQQIGTVGGTGTGGNAQYPPHLHFGVYLGALTRDGAIGFSQSPDPNTVSSGYVDPTNFISNFHSPSTPGKADLVIRNAGVDDTSVKSGQEVRVEWEVKNVGTGDAGGSVAGVYLSKDANWSKSTDIRVEFNSTRALDAGESDTGESDTFEIPAISGTWYVLVVADEKDVISESGGQNNVWAKKISVEGSSGRPDLVIRNADIDDTSVKPGQEVRVEWEVKNIGTGGAASSVAGVYLSRDASWSKSTDIRVEFNSTTALDAGESDTGESDTFEIPAVSGTWYVLVVADEGQVISEPSGLNNVWSQKITVASAASPMGAIAPLTQDIMREEQSDFRQTKLELWVESEEGHYDILLAALPVIGTLGMVDIP